eukprot:gene2314-1450_t
MSPLDDSVPIVKEILSEEIVHHRVMNELAEKHEVRTTMMDPFFKAGAFIMGAGTAMLGKESMMCCHAAVEITIFDHYNEQLREMELLEEKHPQPESEEETQSWNTIKDYVAKFRDEEKHHQELGENNGAENAPLYPIMYNAIRMACKLGVAIAKRFTTILSERNIQGWSTLKRKYLNDEMNNGVLDWSATRLLKRILRISRSKSILILLQEEFNPLKTTLSEKFHHSFDSTDRGTPTTNSGCLLMIFHHNSVIHGIIPSSLSFSLSFFEINNANHLNGYVCMMTALNDALTKLIQYSCELEEVEKKGKNEELQIQIRNREKLEPLFEERQEALKSVPGFWSGVLASSETPLAALMDKTFDSKIARAVTDFQVKTRAENGKLFHKIMISFKPNVMLEAGTVYREVDSDGQTVSLEPIQWKKGTETLRKSSLFSFFDKSPEGGEEFIEDVARAFDIVFQDPFIATQPDE